MTNPKFNKLLHTKSFSSVCDIIGTMSYGDSVSKSLNKPANGRSVYSAACGESPKQWLEYEYVVSEKYNPLINDNCCKTDKASTSTIFYDLDEIAKRHSFHCFTEPSISNANFMKVMKMPAPFNVFGGEATAIVQECATQIHPKLLPRDSIEVNTKRVKKHSRLSSEICLRDDDFTNDRQRTHYYRDKSSRQQKFWSYSKYRTEYTKPIPEEKKAKKKDRGKRTEDPCPCQLFSYACPCTDKKSLTELAKNSKSLTIVDQITSTPKLVPEQKKDTKTNKAKKNKHELIMEDKPTNTSVVKMIEVTVPNKKNDLPTQVANIKDVPILADKNNVNRNPKNRLKSHKKLRKVVCPSCKEKVEVEISLSTTEEEASLKYEHSSICRSEEISSTAAYACRAAASSNNHRSKIMEERDLCLHDPRCELLPICQILPNDNFHNVNQKSVNKNSVPKSTPRVIRITKACRHHPPCTVVPSCQRATVLKNNCEYIPPCLHRPRCVNIPLCVPFSKNLHYEETTNKVVEDLETTDCPHIPRCKFVPVCQHDSFSNTINHQINMISRVQNACEFLSDYNTPAFLVNPTPATCGSTFSPFQLSPTNTCFTEQFTCRSNKSCQFDSSLYKCSNESNENPSDETVIFIRDVGCQFRNKTYSPKGSLLESKASSNSFDFVDVKMGNYCTNVHTLRYEDKFTSPLSGEEQSYSTVSVTSISLDPASECPSHGQRPMRGLLGRRPTTGFTPKSAYTTAFSAVEQSQPLQYEVNKSEAYLVKSRRQFLKGKYKNMFSVKRRRKSRMSNL